MPHAIPTENAGTLTTDRVVELLDTKLDGALDSLFGRDADDFADDGVYVPTPDDIVREPAPGPKQAVDAHEVVFFTGQRQPPQYGDFQNVASSNESVVPVVVPWTVSFAFSRALREAPTDQILGGELDEAEILNRRAKKYAGALRHTLVHWGQTSDTAPPRSYAIGGVEIESSLGSSMVFSPTDDDFELRGGGFVEFSIEQWQTFPSHDRF